MQSLCQRLYVPCAFLRMILVAIIVSAAVRYQGGSFGLCVAAFAISMIVLQALYFAFVVFAIWLESIRRD